MGISYICVVHLLLYTIIQDRCYNRGGNNCIIFILSVVKGSAFVLQQFHNHVSDKNMAEIWNYMYQIHCNHMQRWSIVFCTQVKIQYFTFLWFVCTWLELMLMCIKVTAAFCPPQAVCSQKMTNFHTKNIWFSSLCVCQNNNYLVLNLELWTVSQQMLVFGWWALWAVSRETSDHVSIIISLKQNSCFSHSFSFIFSLLIRTCFKDFFILFFYSKCSHHTNLKSNNSLQLS